MVSCLLLLVNELSRAQRAKTREILSLVAV